ncbi:MAG: YfhO family protein [bacterium]|nr:YfhO family protein [bacterium]
MKYKFFKTHKFFILLIVVLLALGFFKLLSPDFTVRWDIYDVHYHNLSFIADSYQETGQLPLWNPHQYSGYPNFADPQPAMYYPPHLLLIILGAISLTTIKLLLFSHLLLAAVAMYILAWEFFKNKNIALLLGLAYALSGFFVGHTSHLGIVYSYAWLPLVVFFLYKAFRKNFWVYSLLAGLIGALIILAGHAQSTLVIFVFINLGIIYYGLRRYLKNKKLKVLLLVVLIILIFNIFSIGLSAIQLLPTQQFANLSLRSDISLEISQTESLEPKSLATLLVPNFFDAVTLHQYWGPWDVTQHNLYIGIAPLLLVFIGIFYTRYKHKFYFIIAGLGVLSYALGKFFIVQPFFYKYIPLFDKIRAPSNVSGLFIFCLVILAGYGLHRIINVADSEKKDLRIKLKRISKYIISLFGMLFIVALGFAFRYYFNVSKELEYNWIRINITAGVFVSLVLVAITLFIISYCLIKNKSKQTLAILLTVTLLIDLLGFTMMNKLVASSGRVSDSEKHSSTQEYLLSTSESNIRVHSDGFDEFQTPSDLQLTKGYNPINLRTYSEFLNTSNIAEDFFNRVMDTLNVQYAYNLNPGSFMNKWEQVADGIYKNPGQPKYAWFVSEVKGLVETEPKDQIHKLIKTDLKNIAWVDVEFENKVGGVYDLGESSVDLISHEPNRIELNIFNEKKGFIVVSEVYYPGWQVEVDGQKESLYQTDGTLRGFQLEPGAHKVNMYLDPPIYNRGKLITYIFIGLWSVGLIAFVIYKYLYKSAKMRYNKGVNAK